MIGLLFILGFGLWLVAAIYLTKRIPRWLGVTKHLTATSVLLFPVVLAAPVADELIGRWQFHRLCDREAVVIFSPDAKKVKKARHNDDPVTEIGGYAIPIRVQRVEYVDVDTGHSFLSFKAFHTYGGFLFGRLGLGLGQSTTCWPKEKTHILNELNTDLLLEQGKTKSAPSIKPTSTRY